MWTGISKPPTKEEMIGTNPQTQDPMQELNLGKGGYIDEMKPVFRYTPLNRKEIDSFPDRVDRLVNYITKVYFPDRSWMAAAAEKKLENVRKMEEYTRKKHRDKYNQDEYHTSMI